MTRFHFPAFPYGGGLNPGPCGPLPPEPGCFGGGSPPFLPEAAAAGARAGDSFVAALGVGEAGQHMKD